MNEKRKGNSSGRRMVHSARGVALWVLVAVETEEAYANAALKMALGRAALTPRDAALATQLVLGVLQQRMLLDYAIGEVASIRLSKMEAVLRNALRLGLYQLQCLDKVPAHAAIHESVALVKQSAKHPKAAGMANAVLRNLQRQEAPLTLPRGLGEQERLSLQYSHPLWLVRQYAALLSDDECEALLAHDNEASRTYIQTNLRRISGEALEARLMEEGVQAIPHPFVPDCFLLHESGQLEALPAFRDGLFYVQDPAARLAVMAAGVQKGERVLDACAAPGGKSYGLAMDIGEEGELRSCDIHPHKIALLEAGKERLGLTRMQPFLHDATAPREDGLFSTILADVPCSGLGVIRKKPEIRYKDPALMEELPPLQRRMLDTLARYVAPAGQLLYSTCTLRVEENEAVVQAFLREHPEFQLEAFRLPGLPDLGREGFCTLWPQRHDTDGFFIAKLRRTSR